jgi:hypothetical protein
MHRQSVAVPALADLAGHNIGAWLWSGPAGPQTPTGNTVVMTEQFGPQHVWIEHRDHLWFAGVEEDGQCLIAGTWQERSDSAGVVGQLIGVTGKYSQAVLGQSALTSEQRTQRIWSYLQGKALGMTLHITIGADQFDHAPGKAAPDFADAPGRLSCVADLLTLWDQPR